MLLQFLGRGSLIIALALLADPTGAQPAQIQSQPEGRTANVNGMQMYYEMYGEGFPLVLLHGFKASGQVWKPVIPEFVTKHKVIVPDLRGHGRSTNPLKQFTHRQAALDLLALLDQLRIGRFSAIGISNGGMILLHVATQKQSRIDAMILVGATSYFPEEARAVMRQNTVENLTPDEWEAARRIHRLGDDQIRMLTAQFHSFKDNYDDMNFTPAYLSTIKARTLIIHGDRDPFFPVQIAVDMYRAIPQAYLWVVPNGGHVPIFADPAPFVKTSLEFFEINREKQ